MDKQALEQLLERSAETDWPTLLKAKEEAKRQMREDPSPQNVSVFEKVSRMLEARMAHGGKAQLGSTKDVLAFLSEEGRKVKKSKLYADIKSGLLRKQPDGTFSESEVLAYAESLPVMAVPKKDSEQLKELAARRQLATIHKLEEETSRIQFRAEVERGKYIPRENLELELASRGVVLGSGIRQAVEMNVLDLIHLVGGDPRKSQEFLERFEAMLDEALNEYSSVLEFEVTYSDEIADATGTRG
ncbi:hypothetical protein LWC08_02750 [Desulfobaculum bizertense]|uniref:hypothetical protein n=1 Tax=Desulfobaculum bizertense TaxID=376490 RepID=UPI001F463EE5|nr:hypothetical protein [Desulfobaculum bizertense]UIJ38503.1 hypothetical protein LWC08_02750 [Desulfobaculum bizertense]